VRPSRPVLTPRQREILDWIQAFCRRQGAPPTVREIGEAFAMRSTGSVRDHLEALRRKGFLGNSRARRHRGLALIRPVREIVQVPLPTSRLDVTVGDLPVREIPILGRIAAGSTLLAEENLEGTVSLGPELLPRTARSAEIFALRVQGESMVGVGILPGDLITVRRQATAEAGDIVVAMVDGEVTVKTFRPAGDSILLEPANPAFSPIVLDATSGPVSLLGKVVGVVRQYGV